jgi:hypothetical protein
MTTPLPLHPEDLKHLEELKKNGNYDKEFVELLKRQYDRGLVLYPVILDAEGRVVCGWHRLLASPDWPRVKYDWIKHGDALKYELLHHTSREERLAESVNKMAAEMKKENPSLTASQIAEKIGEEYGYDKTHILNMIKSVPKRRTKPPRTVQTGRLTVTLPEVLLKLVKIKAKRQNIKVSKFMTTLVAKALIGDLLSLLDNTTVPLGVMQDVIKDFIATEIPNITVDEINDILVTLVEGGMLREVKVDGQTEPCFQLDQPQLGKR